MDREKCRGCPLDGVGTPLGLTGNKRARFLVVTGIPREEDAARGRSFHPLAKAVFVKQFSRQGFGKEDFSFIPYILCAHDEKTFPTKDRRLIAKTCREHLRDTIEEIDPETIFPLGAEPSSAVFGRSVKITKVRGSLHTYSNERSYVYPLISPLQVALYPENTAIFESDIKNFGRLLDNDYDVKGTSLALGEGKFEYVDDLQFLIDQQPDRVAYDTETTSLRWYAPGATILTMQFAIGDGKAYVLPWNHPLDPKRPSDRRKAQLRKQLRQLLCRPEVLVLGQNTKYDTVMTAAHAGVKFRIGGDTLMLATLIDENTTMRGLDVLVKRYVPEFAGYSDHFDRTVDKSRMAEHPLNDEYLVYSGGDAYATYEVDDVLYNLVAEDEALLNHYHRVSIPALNLFVGMELRGWHIDESRFDTFQSFMEGEVQTQYEDLLNRIHKDVLRDNLLGKYDEYGVDKGIKFSRPKFVKDLLFLHEKGFRLTPKVFTKSTAELKDEALKEPSVSSKDHLPFFFEECPFTMDLAQHVKDEKLLTKSIVSYKKKYIVDGMVRPQYSISKVVTGRTSSYDPNGQNGDKRSPRAIHYRRCFIAPDGQFWVGADLSQAELRLAANYANEKRMLKIYREGGDIHATTAAAVLGVSMKQFKELSKKEQKSARQKAKAINFGSRIQAPLH